MIQVASKYQEVGALEEATEEWTPGSGEVWEVAHFQGSGAYLDDTTAAVVWDYGEAGAVIVAATHGDAEVHAVGYRITGDGSKVLAIVLTNDTDSAHVMGGRYEAKRIS